MHITCISIFCRILRQEFFFFALAKKKFLDSLCCLIYLRASVVKKIKEALAEQRSDHLRTRRSSGFGRELRICGSLENGHASQ